MKKQLFALSLIAATTLGFASAATAATSTDIIGAGHEHVPSISASCQGRTLDVNIAYHDISPGTFTMTQISGDVANVTIRGNLGQNNFWAAGIIGTGSKLSVHDSGSSLHIVFMPGASVAVSSGHVHIDFSWTSPLNSGDVLPRFDINTPCTTPTTTTPTTAPPRPTTTTSTTVPPKKQSPPPVNITTTTVKKALPAPQELPNTGGSSLPLTFVAGAMIGGGALCIFYRRKPRTV